MKLSAKQRKVVLASSLGTVFEWYDFYLYGSLAAIIAKQFFTALDPTSAFIFALLAFAAGFIVRPFGALVFGRLGDMVGRKHTFLVTIVIMGASTFLVGVLPGYETLGCRDWRSAESTAGPPPSWPSTRRLKSVARIPRGSRPPPRWACSCR
jgi:MFS family permease